MRWMRGGVCSRGKGRERMKKIFLDFDPESYYNMLWTGIFMPKGSIIKYTLNDGKGDVIILRR